MKRALPLRLFPERLSIVRLPAGSPIPDWAGDGSLVSITRTPDELSVVCPTRVAPALEQRSDGWRALQVEGPLEFSEVGVIAGISRTIAEEGISIFVLSTWDTDYLLVRAEDLERAVESLQRAGHTVSMQQNGGSDV